MDTITITLQSVADLLTALAAVFGVFAQLAVYLPPPLDNAPGWYVWTHKWVNYLGRNEGHAENKQ